MAGARVLQFDFSAGDHDADGWRVVSFDWNEELNGGSRGTVALETKASDAIAPDSLLGKTARLTVGMGEGRAERHFHGVVLAAAARALPDKTWGLTVSVGARLELLRLGQVCRLFQKKSVPDIVRAVLKDAGIPDDAQKWALDASYPERDATIEFNESDWDFILRLLADVGIGLAVRSSGEDHDLAVFFDDDQALDPVAEEDTVQPRTTTSPGGAQLGELEQAHQVASDAVMLRDYDFLRPSLDLSATEKADSSTGREVYLHPGGFRELSDGKHLALVELQRLRVRTQRVGGESDHSHLEPGRTLTLQSFARGELNDDLLLVSVHHQGRGTELGTAASYRNAFQAIPKSTPWRPPTRPPPSPSGLELAFVTGPDGQELHGNAQGQVKVRFPWDPSGVTDDRSSPWLRVGQLALGGSMLIPRVGFEVLVDHELGDRDRPVVVGHLYNGEAPPPYDLPDGATRGSFQTATTAGGGGANELRFEDAAGSEEMFFNASRDYTFSAEHDAVVSVGSDDKEEVGSNHSVSIGANRKEEVVGARSLTVGTNQKLDVGGDYSDGVKGPVTLEVGAMRRQTVTGDLSENVVGAAKRTVGGLQAVTGIAGVQRKVVGSSTISVGAAWMETVAMSRSTTCGGTRLETIAGLKMIKAKTMSVDCGQAHVLNAGTLQTTVGGDRSDSAGRALAITAGGGLIVKADNINIVAENKLVFRVGGSTLELTPGGVKLKSPSVDLKGVKALGSTQHSSGG
jgi:type VI secretion system secreted protein VgrG